METRLGKRLFAKIGSPRARGRRIFPFCDSVVREDYGLQAVANPKSMVAFLRQRLLAHARTPLPPLLDGAGAPLKPEIIANEPAFDLADLRSGDADQELLQQLKRCLVPSCGRRNGAANRVNDQLNSSLCEPRRARISLSSPTFL
jgi:hypothetical protein